MSLPNAGEQRPDGLGEFSEKDPLPDVWQPAASAPVVGQESQPSQDPDRRPSVLDYLRSLVDALRRWLHYVLFDLILRRGILPASKDGRHIPLCLGDNPARPPQLIDERRGLGFLSNAIRTSRYTVLDFIPKQLLFQFTRVSNFYFLCVGIPQTIPGISTTGNFTTILPLLFFVLLTVVKEGYDDYKRHRLDKVENARIATVLRRAPDADEAAAAAATLPVDPQRVRRFLSRLSVPKPVVRFCRRRGWLRKEPAASTAAPKRTGEVELETESCGFRWTPIPWQDIRVGDVVRMTRDEDVPADLLLLHADGEGGLAYIETMALDGETNLKSKQVPASLAKGRCATIKGLVACPARVVAEDPNADLYRFDGRISVDGETLPLTLTEVVYRGSTLRNTPCAIGLVLNTGEECKSRMNANRHPRAKKPALERVTNSIVLILAAYVILLSAGCSIGYFLWNRTVENKSWYIWDATVPAHEIILGFAIQFNNIVPLALYVSLEIVKIGQMLLLNADVAMYDPVSDTPARCNTNTILENLGQIGYVFSDKTGTLTENVMKFRKMSVAGTSWLHEADLEKVDDIGVPAIVEDLSEEDVPEGDAKTLDGTGAGAALSRLAPDNRLSVDTRPRSFVATSPRVSQVFTERPRMSIDSSRTSGVLSPLPGRRSSSHWRSTARPDHAQPELTTDDLMEYVRLRPHTPFSRKVVTYILAMALCHTCLPELQDGKVVDFQAASPDELALVRAAEELGILVVQKSAKSTTLRFTYNNPGNDPDHPPTEEVYEVLDVIEFSSQRKRMSIVVRRPDGRIWLICKGADSTILPRLKMAPLALQKAQDVRKSADLERELMRKSAQFEPRSSLGGPASVTIRKSIGGRPGGGGASSLRPPMMARGPSFDVPAKVGRLSLDVRRVHHTPETRAPSFDLHSLPRAGDRGDSGLHRSSTSANRPLRLAVSHAAAHHLQHATVPEKFAYLESAAFLGEDEGDVFDRCFRHMDDFAAEGLRTLLYAQKNIPAADYATWKAQYLAAATSLTDRQERIEAAAEAIEQNLDLIGASAIEDKLQKGVPETIDKLRRANVKVWMLTGDKRETAINIAHSARLCMPASEIYVLDAAKGDLSGQLLHIAENLGVPESGNLVMASRAQRILRTLLSLPFLPFSSGQGWPALHQRRSHTVVVIDGHTLGVIEKQQAEREERENEKGQKGQKGHKRTKSTASVPFSIDVADPDPDLRYLFYSIIQLVDSVICCRASPSQKALLVRSIRHRAMGNASSTPGLTLAIGDGANDLAMLAEAHVGVGVSGKEGLQAARVADYSVAQFRFLGRLLLVHGRWNYVRTARFILATFYKEMFIYVPALAYQWFCGYTGTSIYESWSLTVLNTLFTSLCVILPGICEQDLSASTLLAVPELYVFGQRGDGLNPPRYVGWMLTAAAQGVLVFFGCWAGYGAFDDQRDDGLFALGNLMFSVCIMWTNMKLFILSTHFKSAIVLFGFCLTMCGWWAWQAFLSVAYSQQPSPYDGRDGFIHGFGRHLAWWATLLVVLAVLAVSELGYEAVRRNLRIADVWREPSRRRQQRKQRKQILKGKGKVGGSAAATALASTWLSRWRCQDAGDADDVDYNDSNNSHSTETADGDGSSTSDGDSGSSGEELPADKLDLALWQEMEKDLEVRERLRLINGEDDFLGPGPEDETAKWWQQLKYTRRKRSAAEEDEDEEDA